MENNQLELNVELNIMPMGKASEITLGVEGIHNEGSVKNRRPFPGKPVSGKLD